MRDPLPNFALKRKGGKVKRFLAASEIAALKLPGLPTTKVAIAAMAKREGWHSEQRTGLGGVRRVYELPARYREKADEGTSFAVPQVAKLAGTIAAGSSRVNPGLLDIATRALYEWEAERDVQVDPERRSAIIAILYDYLQGAEAGQGEDAMELVLRALG